MQKQFRLAIFALLCFGLTACSGVPRANTPPTSSGSESSSLQEMPEANKIQQPPATESVGATVRLTFSENEAIISLVDNETTRDFVSRLPLTQTFEDFNSIEKICRLPEALSVEGVEQGVDPAVADITLYVPWNTLVFYYKDFGYHEALIPIGRVESGMDLLEAQAEDFTVTLELITDFDGASSATDKSTGNWTK